MGGPSSKGHCRYHSSCVTALFVICGGVHWCNNEAIRSGHCFRIVPGESLSAHAQICSTLLEVKVNNETRILFFLKKKFRR